VQVLAAMQGTDAVDMSLTHLFMLRREQGRIAEIVEFAEAALADRPGLRALQAALVLADLEAGHELAASKRFAALTRRGISLPRDFTWTAGMFVLAEVTARLGEGEPAAALYAELAPYAGRIVVVGMGGAVLGASDRALGQLALLGERFDDADDHFTKAVALEQRLGAHALVARSRYWQARALLARRDPRVAQADRLLSLVVDDADALGMTRLADETRALMSTGDTVLTTVLFTDIVGSTAAATRLGDASWRAVLDDHDRFVRSELRRYGGTEVQYTGDGFLAAFDSPVRAVRCGLAIVHGAHHTGVEVRAGVHTGECQRRGDDLAGLAVHVGARVAAQAGAREVFVSRTVADLLAGSGLRFQTRGRHELKGVDGTVELLSLDEPV
jgi:class 3 adenylate cyclase